MGENTPIGEIMNNKLNTALIVITYITSGILIILNGLAIYNYIYLLSSIASIVPYQTNLPLIPKQ